MTSPLSSTHLPLIIARHPLFFAGGIGIVLAGIGWIVLLVPAFARWDMAKQTVDEQRNVQATVERSRAHMEQLQRAVADISDGELQKVQSVAPEGRDVPRLIVELEALATETGVSLTDVLIRDVNKQQKQDTMPELVCRLILP